jgi:putative FmdB family regulatory protein
MDCPSRTASISLNRPTSLDFPLLPPQISTFLSFSEFFFEKGLKMPTYQYACTACGHEFEVFQSFTEDSLTECPECKGEVKKVFSAVGVVFKGSGFYKTDSAKSSTASVPPATSAPAPTPKAE